MAHSILVNQTAAPRSSWARLMFASAWILGATLVSPVGATSVIAPSFPELVERAETVVHGSVTDIRTAWVDQAGHRVIKTWVSIQIEDQLKGGDAQSSITLEFLGGRVGDSEMTVHGSPRFTVGDEVIVFIHGNGRDVCPLLGWGHGAYRVATSAASGAKQILRINGLPLQSPSDVELPLTTLSARHPAVQSLASVPGMSLAGFKEAIRQQQNQAPRAN